MVDETGGAGVEPICRWVAGVGLLSPAVAVAGKAEVSAEELGRTDSQTRWVVEWLSPT